mmetsp:Transcript_23624/g.33734  ORF Transcript_23624/g.33734 Transcript_23624/m.33734 type:complete len:175 (+) Transcript_23624:141-665(+)|eukprot:CAMPEP_0201697574 /NCGR_PEP_ID=MMETSP0578-20130828/11394_1 /ASSEMBLY_ACC=CAM_ASM_000663 /TAXON_ID=267565 /ORGANISM="Skeletonema grethea, Strain CCMP 1804" /LENGTH=174 /DNA_ID=CAMNT_0048183771 /DNA_START=117 /DNA_END=641 /DNA_ORIENTATION=-
MPALETIQCKSLPDKTWTPVNSAKNESLTIIFQCGWSGERIAVPHKAPSNNDADDTANYFDEPNSDSSDLRGYTTLQDAVHAIKGKLPALYLMEEQGAASMTCGSNEICRTEWETTMLCHLIFDQDNKSDKEVEQVILEDGRIAFVVNIGGEIKQHKEKPTIVTRCLKKHDTYG